MTRRRRVLLAGGAAALLVLAGCGAHRARQSPAAADSASPTSGPRTAPARPTTATTAGAVSVARAFAAAICPYSYQDSVPYGQRLNTALARWGSPGFVAGHIWSRARIRSATAGLLQHRAEQVCGLITGGSDPEAPTSSTGQVLVRLSVTVTASSATGSASSAQQVFSLVLVHRGARWLIEDGQW